MKKLAYLFLAASIHVSAMNKETEEKFEAMLKDHINSTLSIEQFNSSSHDTQRYRLNSLLCGVISDFAVFPKKVAELKEQLFMLIKTSLTAL